MSVRPILGWSQGDPTKRVPVTYPGDAHLLTLAIPGSGKSLCVAVPNLLHYEGSMVVCDFKGELTQATAIWRSTMLGQDVRVFDPFGVVDRMFLPQVDGKPCYARINPIDFIRRSRSPQTAAFCVSESLIPPGGMKETHWTDAAQLRLVATLLFVALDPFLDGELAQKVGWKRDMRTAWKMLSNPEDESSSLAVMLDSKNSIVADQAATFCKPAKANIELANIRNHLRVNCTKTLSEAAIIDTMDETNIDFRQMGKKPMTVYIVLPGDMAQIHYRYMRLLVSIALSEVEAGGLREFGRSQPPTLFLLDEFATLGKFPLITEAMGRMRGFGIQFHAFVQTLGQLKGLYGDGWQTILGNAGIVQYFGGTSDLFTAETISKLCGVTTRVQRSINNNSMPGNAGGESYGTYKRDLLTPDEVMRLKLPVQLILSSGKQPCPAMLFHPSLADFPQYLKFMVWIEAGSSPEQARIAAIGQFQIAANDNASKGAKPGLWSRIFRKAG